jgi:hypothetical protein
MLLEQEMERVKIETELADAKRRGNAEAIAALTAQLALIDQIHAKQLANLAEQEAEKAISDAADAARDAARWANLSVEEQQNENALSALEDQLAAAILARDDLTKQAIINQIAAENARHTQVMDNLSAEQKAIAGTIAQADALASSTSDAGGSATPPKTETIKTVQINVAMPGGGTAKVNVLPGQEDIVTKLIQDLMAAKAVAQ